MKKPTIWAVLIVICAVTLLTACSPTTETYPEIEAADIENMNLSKLKNSTLSYSYPSDSWIGQPNSDPLSILWAEDVNNSEALVNIQTSIADRWSGKLSQKDLDAFKEVYINSYGDTIKIKTSEMRSLKGEPVLYFEWTQAMSEASIQAMLDSGEWTAEWLEMNGGFDAFLNMEPVDMVVVMGVVDEHLICYIGSYYEEESKADILDAITVLFQTSEVVK